MSHFQETSKSPARTSYNNFNVRASTQNADLSTDSRPVVPKKLAEMSPFQNKTNNTKQTNQQQSNDDFLQRVLEIQQQQLAKATYFIQVTYCFETDFCHRFINFEINESLVAQFENQILEDFIQQAYQREKGGLLYHKVQEVPLDLIEKSRKQA